MAFRKIVVVDDCGLEGPFRNSILSMSDTSPSVYRDDPCDEAEIIERVGDADCVLVSWRTRIGKGVFRACPSIRYVGMCCSLYDEQSANVDIAAAGRHGIAVTGVRDYGDEGTVEFIVAQLITLYKGLNGTPWKGIPTELGGKRLGVVGMGTVGGMVARAARAFGMEVCYHSRTRKPEAETDGMEYLELGAVLQSADVVSLHLPRNTSILGKYEFGQMKNGAVLVNTSLGRPFCSESFFTWLDGNEDNYGIFDLPGAEAIMAEGQSHTRCIVYPRSSGFTREARERLTRKVHGNMIAFLGSV